MPIRQKPDMRRTRRLIVLLLSASIVAQAQTAAPPLGEHSKTRRHKSARPQPPEQSFILVGAGDIASCKQPQGAEATAKLIEQIPGTVFAAGDLAYERGTPAEFEKCYGPTWGRFKDRTKPAPGNHEYDGSLAVGYFQYWGGQAGPPEKGYYSYDLGAWHIIVLNTNCGSQVLGGCGQGSPQEQWLHQDLAEHPNACILAYGHHALLSSGVFKRHAIHPELKPLWQDLYYAHADLVLAGHEHSYERFAPQDPDGNADAKLGIREIVVGTGGRSHDPLGLPIANSEARDSETYGVLKLTLSPGKYAWEFIPEEGKTFRDTGAADCHNASARATH
jgi:calcineurin-like phosphoesterase family protein